MRILCRIALICFLLAVTGCGGSGDKNKNKDKDVPKPAEGVGK